MACRTDPALPLLVHTTEALATLFGPSDDCPPLIGSTENVRTIAGDGLPLEAWDAHKGGGRKGGGCAEPFIWQRVRRRYRSTNFPHPAISTSPCAALRVIELELGVGWCAEIGSERGQVAWERLDAEATKSMDVAWRLEEALCLAAKKISDDEEGRHTGTDTLVPYGPDAGVIAWSGILYASY